ncbi:MAG: AMP-binding protein [Bacteroidota bacterium]
MTAITDKTRELTAMETIPSFFEKSCDRFPGNIYLREKTGRQYAGITYRETRLLVYRFAAGLMALGIQPGDRVALISEGRNAWVISELGVLYAGAINVPISVKLTEPEELKFRINHAGVRMVIVSGQQAPKINSIREGLEQLEWIVLLDPPGAGGGQEMLFDQVLDAGWVFLETHAGIFDARWRAVCHTDVANICYTSGTTADPKGIMLTHGNYISNVYQGYSLMDIQENYCTLLILPWDHAFAHTAGIYCFMGRGASVASVQWGKSPQEGLRNLPGNIREIRPQILLSVPALADNFKKNIEKGIRERGYFIARLFHLAMKMSYWYNRDGHSRGKGGTWIAKPLMNLFAGFFVRKVRNHFGGQLEFFVGGGALLDIEYQRFFYALGIPMFQGYGLTEASPIISSNTALRHKLGSSGAIAGNLELKICNEQGETLPVGIHGEIVVKGANVMKGYWKNEEATRAAIRDGWLYTGDLGYLDADGFLYVLGRYKSLLIANDGEKFSPEGMEESFCGESEFIDQCMLYNNQDPVTVILLVPALDKIREYLAHLGLDPLSAEGQAEALLKIEEELKEYRKGGRFADRFPQRWLPAAIGILDSHFTEENHLLNSTLKMVRGRIVEHYRERIDYLYTPSARDILNQRNVSAIRAILDPTKKQG